MALNARSRLLLLFSTVKVVERFSTYRLNGYRLLSLSCSNPNPESLCLYAVATHDATTQQPSTLTLFSVLKALGCTLHNANEISTTTSR